MKFGHLEKIRSLAVVGATGLVGQQFVTLLNENKIKIQRVKLLASEDSIGARLELLGHTEYVEVLDDDSFNGVEVAFFSVPDDITRDYVPRAAKAGCLVVDDSSVYRMEKETLLVVPEINGILLRDFQGQILSTPNCTVTPLVLCLKPILDRYGIDRVVVSTYQSVSGAGKAALEEFSKQAISLLSGRPEEPRMLPHRLAFNCIPQVGEILENGSCEEEEKVVRETRKILGDNSLQISASTVRVPTFCGHGLSVNVALKKDFSSVEEIREILNSFPGVRVLDQPKSHIYPTNVECIGSDRTMVGRIRRDFSVPSGLNFWVITDNLRKGAALNAMEILEVLYNYRNSN